jgi:hypothetical protein
MSLSPTTPSPVSPSSSPRKVLLVGWNAADWKVIQPLLDAGKMPHLDRFLEQGVRGNTATLQPAPAAPTGSSRNPPEPPTLSLRPRLPQSGSQPKHKRKA